MPIDVNLKICFRQNKHIEKRFSFTFHLASNGAWFSVALHVRFCICTAKITNGRASERARAPPESENERKQSRERESQSIFFLVSIKCAARVRLGGWNSHIYYVENTRNHYLSIIMQCQIAFSVADSLRMLNALRHIVPTIKLLTELTTATECGWCTLSAFTMRIVFPSLNAIKYTNIAFPLSTLTHSRWLFRS